MNRTFSTVTALFAATVIAEYAAPGLRYLKYLVPVVALVLVAIQPPNRTRNAATRAFDDLLVVTAIATTTSLLAALFEESATSRLALDAFFIFAPLVTARLIAPFAPPHHRYVDALFGAVVVAYAVSSGPAALAMLRDPQAMLFALYTSISDAESGLSFVFGMFCIYYLMQRRHRAALLAFLFVVLSIKRIAIGGVLAAAFASVIVGRIDTRKYRTHLAVAAVIVNALIVLAIQLLARGEFDRWIRETTGLSTEWATMGRAELYDLIDTKLPLSLFGHGLGSTTVLLERSGMTAINAHSDVLKYAVEVGPIVASLWLFAFFRLAAQRASTLVLAIYLNVLFVTDNVSIYVDVMLVFYVLFAALATAPPPHGQHDPRERDRETRGEPEAGEMAALGT